MDMADNCLHGAMFTTAHQWDMLDNKPVLVLLIYKVLLAASACLNFANVLLQLDAKNDQYPHVLEVFLSPNLRSNYPDRKVTRSMPIK